MRLHCECKVDGKVVLDGEGLLSVPPGPGASRVLTLPARRGSFRACLKRNFATGARPATDAAFESSPDEILRAGDRPDAAAGGA